MKIEENIALKDYTTFNIGGPAKVFARCRSEKDVCDAVLYAHEHGLSYFVLGGGSNILASDAGFNGLVIRNEIEGIEYSSVEPDGAVLVTAGAGVSWDGLVADVVEKGLYGLENLSLIPGTVGAAPVQNIGAYGKEIGDAVEWVEAINSGTCTLRRFTRNECAFGYRTSFFKTPEGRNYIIVRVCFRLVRTGTLDTTYRDISEYIAQNKVTDISLKTLRDMVVAIRTAKLPDLAMYGTAGSFFKNPVITETEYKALTARYPAMPVYSSKNGKVKISAAWVLDNICGFKGYRKDSVGVYEKQALVLVNFGNASSSEINEMAKAMEESFFEKTGIRLEREVVSL